MNLPDGWLSVKLADVAVDLQPGFAQRPKEKGNGTPQLRTNNVSPEGTIDLSELSYVDVAATDLEKYRVRKGDVIFNNTNSVEWVGKTAYFEEEGDYVLSNHMTRIRVDERVLNAEFLAKYLHHLWRIGEARRWAKHWVNQAAIDQAILQAFRLPLPPLSEQRRIVSILREAHALGQMRERMNKRANDLLPALFLEMFGDPVANEKKWPSLPLKQMGSVNTGNTPPRDDPGNYGDFIDWVKSDNLDSAWDFVTETKERLSKKGAKVGRVVPSGSTLITCIAGSPDSIGKAALARKPVAFNQQINAVTPFKKVNPLFLYAQIKLLKAAIQALSSGGMKGIVNKKQLEHLTMISPPQQLQERFAIEAERVLEFKEQANQARLAAQVLLPSLLVQAFTGHLTAKWREKQSEELAHEVAERSQLLGQTKKLAPIVIRVDYTPQVFVKREKLVEALSSKQRNLAAMMETMLGHFTADQLHSELDGDGTLSIADVQQTLRLLADAGLLLRVRVAAQPAERDRIAFIAAFRALRDEDDTKRDDLRRLKGTYQ